MSAGRVLRKFGFLGAAFAAVGEKIPRIARRHQARAGERQRDAAGVDGDPAPTPLLGDIGGGAGAAGGVEHEVAGSVAIRMQRSITLVRLNNIDLVALGFACRYRSNII